MERRIAVPCLGARRVIFLFIYIYIYICIYYINKGQTLGYISKPRPSMAGSPPCGVVWRPKFQFFSRFRINFCKFLLSSNSTWFYFRRLFVKHQNLLNCNKHRTIPRFPPFEFSILVSKTYRKLTCVRDRVGDVICFSFMLIFYEKYAFGTPSEYGGIQNDGKNRPCRAKDFEI